MINVFKIFSNKKLIPISIILCLLVSVIFLLYLSCSFLKFYATYSYNKYNVSLENFSLQEVFLKLENINNKNYQKVFIMIDDYVVIEVKDDLKTITEGRNFKNDNEALVGFGVNIKIGSTITICNEEYTVVGKTDSIKGIILPKKKMPDIAKPIKLELEGKNFFSRQAIEKELKAIFNGQYIKFPDKINFIMLFKNVPLAGAFFVYVILSLSPIPIFMLYLLRKNKKVISVYKIVGYSQKQILSIFIKLYLVVLGSVLLIGNLIYLLLERLWFNKISNSLITYNLPFKDYLIVNLFFFIIMSIFSLSVFKFIKTEEVKYNYD